MDSATEVRYGGVIVGRSPQIRDRDDGGAFVVFSEPLPVGTRIAFKLDDQGKEQHARVTEVVESADASVAGMRVRFVSAAERERSGPVAVPAAAAPAPAAAAPAPVAAEASQPSASAVPTPVGGDSSSVASTAVPAGESSAHHAADPNAPHHDGEGGRRRRRRK
ncbi:MAG TPA: hypothetical protein VIF57_22560 [Polyangia bacterium]